MEEKAINTRLCTRWWFLLAIQRRKSCNGKLSALSLNAFSNRKLILIIPWPITHTISTQFTDYTRFDDSSCSFARSTNNKSRFCLHHPTEMIHYNICGNFHRLRNTQSLWPIYPTSQNNNAKRGRNSFSLVQDHVTVVYSGCCGSSSLQDGTILQ